MKQYVYISYDKNDIDSANEVLAYIEGRGVSCFIAPRDINPGERIAKQIVEAVRDSSVAIVICSPSTVGSESLLNEVDVIVEAKKPVIPIFLKSFELSPDLKYYLGRKQRIIAPDGDISGVLDKIGIALSEYVHFRTPEEKAMSAYNVLAYDGEEPYIFVSYAHRDSELVFPIVAALSERGYRVWYDAGIKTGRVWADYIAERLEKSSCVIPMFSKAFLDSDNCLEEISYALDLKIPVITSYVEDVVLKGGLRMRLGLKQGVYLHKYPALDGFVDKLTSAEEISPCLGESAKSNSEATKRFKPIDLDNDEFLIENGVLKEYRGDGGVVNVPEGVKTVAEGAFRDCGIEELYLPEGLTELEPDSFIDCSGTLDISVPSTIESGVILALVKSDMDNMPFSRYKNGCYIGNKNNPYLVFCGWEDNDADSFELHPDTKILDTGCCSDSFWETDIEKIVIPDGVICIAMGAFTECKSLKSIVLPDNVKSIGAYAFSECTSLERIELSGAITAIPDNAFAGCSALRDIDIPRGVKSIGDNAFEHCRALVEIILPEGVTEIGEKAFAYCTALRRLSLPDSLETFPLSAIDTNLMLDMELYKNGEYLGNDENPHVVLCSYNKDFEGLFETASTTKVIASDAFEECEGMTAIDLPVSLRGIGDRAFIGCRNLKTIDIPFRVRRVGESAFERCEGISVSLPIAAETGEKAFPKSAKINYI